MESLNYHHLRYFWAVARNGSIAEASRLLHVSQPSISTQLRQLERNLGEPLFGRQGRRLRLTEAGRTVLVYAEEIFALGRELVDAVRDRPSGQPLRLQVGIADAIPRQLAARLLAPALAGPTRVHLTCRAGPAEPLCAELASYGLDVVLADDAHVGRKVKAVAHLLGQSPLALFGVRRLAARHRPDFPEGLSAVTLVLPLEGSETRRELDRWLHARRATPEVVAEVEDSGLQKALAADGVGLVFAPRVVADDLQKRHGLELVGVCEGLTTRYYALTVARKVRHPAVAELLRGDRAYLAGES